MKRYWVYLGPIFFYYAIVTYLSSRSGFPTVLTQWFLQDGMDKGIHALEYSILGVLACRALANLLGLRGIKLVGVSVALVLVLGGLDEFHQAFVPGRDASVFDLMADGVGGIIGMLIYLLGLRPKPWKGVTPFTP